MSHTPGLYGCGFLWLVLLWISLACMAVTGALKESELWLRVVRRPESRRTGP